jgi:hypothetical protein
MGDVDWTSAQAHAWLTELQANPKR